MRALILSLALLAAFPAQAQQMQCGPAREVFSQLKDKYAESTVGTGKATVGGNLMLLMSANGETWTLLFVTQQTPGSPLMACGVMSGTGWQVLDPAPAPKGEPS